MIRALMLVALMLPSAHSRETLHDDGMWREDYGGGAYHFRRDRDLLVVHSTYNEWQGVGIRNNGFYSVQWKGATGGMKSSVIWIDGDYLAGYCGQRAERYVPIDTSR